MLAISVLQSTIFVLPMLFHFASNSPIFGMQHNGSGVFKAEGVIGINTVFSQFLHKSTIQFRHFDTIQEAVHPVEFPGYPVNCKALPMQNSIDHHLPVTAIKGHPLNHSAAHINPIKTLVNAIKVHGHHTGEALQDQRVGLSVCWQVPQVIAVAEDKVGWDVTVLTAAVAVRLSEKSRGAFTNIGADSVLTDLAAHAWCLRTLVDIVACFAVRHEAVAGATAADKAGGRVGAIVITVMDGWVCAFIDTYSQRHIISTTLFKSSGKTLILSDQSIHGERKQYVLFVFLTFYLFFFCLFRSKSFFYQYTVL